MIYVFLADGFEEIEGLTAVDVLRRAELEVRTVGVGGRTVAGSHGIVVGTDLSEQEVEPSEIEMIVLPGGMPGTLNLERSQAVQAAIDFCAANDRWIAAICAAPSVFGRLGFLKGRRACCYPSFEEKLEGAEVVQEPVSVDGHIITSRGMGTAILFALKLTTLLCGEEKADEISRSIIFS